MTATRHPASPAPPAPRLAHVVLWSTAAPYDARVLAERVGLPVRARDGDVWVFELGDAELVLETAPEGWTSGSDGAQLALQVGDLDAVLEALASTDWAVLVPPTAFGDASLAVVATSGGARLELVGHSTYGER